MYVYIVTGLLPIELINTSIMSAIYLSFSFGEKILFS